MIRPCSCVDKREQDIRETEKERERTQNRESDTQRSYRCTQREERWLGGTHKSETETMESNKSTVVHKQTQETKGVLVRL